MRKLFGFILALFLIGIFPQSTFAQTPNNVRRDEKITLLKDETVDDDYFAVGDNVTISGTVNGDVFVAGGQTYIDGIVNGDLLTAGGQVVIAGPVSGNIRVAGGDVTLSSEVGGNVTILGGNILIDDSATISGSLNGAVGNARILSPVSKSIHIAGGQITVGNEVGKNLKVAVGNLALVNGAHIKGDVVYVAEEEMDISGGAMIDGAVVKKILPEQIAAEKEQKNSRNVFLGLMGFSALFWFVNSFIFGALLLRIAPRYTSDVVDGIRRKFWQNMLTGFVFTVVGPIVIVILLATIFGIPLALLSTVVYFVLMCLGRIMFALFLGTKIQKHVSFAKNKYLVLILGILAYSILTWIPFIGWLIGIVGSFVGTGSLIMTKKELYNQMKIKKML